MTRLLLSSSKTNTTRNYQTVYPKTNKMHMCMYTLEFFQPIKKLQKSRKNCVKIYVHTFGVNQQTIY